jgi:hypothetical protein
VIVAVMHTDMKPPPLPTRKDRTWIYVVVGVCVALCWWFVVPNLHRLHPLYKAVMSGDVRAVHKRLREHPDELEHRFFGLNATPLHLAAGRGDTNMIILLLSLGAEIDAKGYRHGSTPLHCAARHGHVRAIEILVERGADVMARDMHWYTPLHCAAAGDHADAITGLLRLGADINAAGKTYGRTPLGEAVELNHVAAARVLLEHGAKADLDDLIEQKEQDLAFVPLASKEIKDEFRNLIAVLEEHKRKRSAQQPAARLQSDPPTGGSD